VRCLVGQGARRTRRVVMKAGERGGSVTQGWSVDLGVVSMVRRQGGGREGVLFCGEETQGDLPLPVSETAQASHQCLYLPLCVLLRPLFLSLLQLPLVSIAAWTAGQGRRGSSCPARFLRCALTALSVLSSRVYRRATGMECLCVTPSPSRSFSSRSSISSALMLRLLMLLRVLILPLQESLRR
jgi:hypothetical protein